MPYCAVIGCTTKQGDSQYHLHSFPQIKVLREIWLKNLDRKEFKPGSKARICSKHFEQSQFFDEDKSKIKKFAVPTLFHEEQNAIGGDQQSSTYVELPVFPITTHKETSIRENCYLFYRCLPQNELADDSRHHHPTSDFRLRPVTNSASSSENANISLESRYFELKLSIQRQKDDIVQLQDTLLSRNLDLEHLRRDLHTLQKEKEAECDIISKANDLLKCVSAVYSEDQVHALLVGNDKKSSRWSKQTYEKALKLRIACGLKGYAFLLQKNQPLPRLGTLQRYLNLIAKRDQKYICISCGAAAGSASALSEHVSVVHMKKRFQCPICQKRFQGKKGFLKHKARHSEGWKCDACHTSFKALTAYKMHLKSKKHKEKVAELPQHHLFIMQDDPMNGPVKQEDIITTEHPLSTAASTSSASATPGMDMAANKVKEYPEVHYICEVCPKTVLSNKRAFLRHLRSKTHQCRVNAQAVSGQMLHGVVFDASASGPGVLHTDLVDHASATTAVVVCEIPTTTDGAPIDLSQGDGTYSTLYYQEPSHDTIQAEYITTEEADSGTSTFVSADSILNNGATFVSNGSVPAFALASPDGPSVVYVQFDLPIQDSLQ